MRRYDWDFGFGFGQHYRAHPRGYDTGLRGGGYDTGLRRGGFASGQGGDWHGQASGRQGGDLRGVYGEDYPTFGGVPGGRQQGLYYGGREGTNRGGYGPDFGSYSRDAGSGFGRAPEGMSGNRGVWPREEYGTGYRGGRGQQYGENREQSGGYDRGFAQEPFIPEGAYRQHPELNRPQLHRGERWGGNAYTTPGQGGYLDDDEILQGVRQSLYADSWVDADEIDVEVNDGVVTLRGEVDDYLEARYAWDDAWEAGGVRGVINRLTVRVDRPSDTGQQALQSAAGASSGEGGAA